MQGLLCDLNLHCSSLEAELSLAEGKMNKDIHKQLKNYIQLGEGDFSCRIIIA